MLKIVFKKVMYIILIINIILFNMNYTFADDEDELNVEEYLEVINQNFDEPKLNARIAVAYDRTSRRSNMGKR